MSLPTFAPDTTIRFDYDPVVHKIAFPVNHVGAHLSDAIAEAEYAHTDDNTVYVSATSGNDTTGDGSGANPYATLLKSINEASEDRPRVVVLDSSLYCEDLSGADYTYFQGFYAAEGEFPTYDSRVLGFTPADANTIFVAKTGSDTTGDGTQAAPVLTIEKAITLCDATHQAVGIMDSGVYMEKAFTFATNFLMLFALAGCCPEVRFSDDYHGEDHTEYGYIERLYAIQSIDLDGNDVRSIVTLNNGNLFVLLNDGNTLKWTVVSKATGSLIKEIETIAASYSYQQAFLCITGDGYPVVTYTSTDRKFCRYVAFGIDGLDTYKTGAWVSADGTVYYAYNNGLAGLDGDRFCGGVHIDANITPTTTVLWYNRVVSIDGTSWPAGIELFQIGSSPSQVSHQSNACSFGNGTCLLWYNKLTTSTTVYRVYEEDDAGVIKAETQLYAALTYNKCSVLLGNGNVAVVFRTAANVWYYAILDSSGNIIVSATAIGAATNGARTGMCYRSSDDSFFVLLNYYDAGSNTDQYFISHILNDGTIVETTLANDNYASDGTLAQRIFDVRPDGEWWTTAIMADGRFETINAILNNPIIISAAAGIDGIKFGNTGAHVFSLAKISAQIGLAYCTIQDIVADSSVLSYYRSLYGNAAFSMENCLVDRCERGAYIESNDVSILSSIIMRTTVGHALHVKGAGSDIVVEHCDFFGNYGSIRLEDNDGNEVIKNNILHDNSNGALLDVEVVHSNTVNTDSNTNLTDGASVISTNPLYKNEGAVNPDDTDLNIRTRVEGFPADSPAYGLADDDRNAGSYDVRYIGTETTWSSITVPKPPEIKPYLKPVGNVFHEKSVQSTKTAQNLVVPMRWAGIMNDDLEDLLDMWCCSSAEVRVYPNPETLPNDYEVYQLKYGNISLATAYYPTQESGRQDIELEFERGYER